MISQKNKKIGLLAGFLLAVLLASLALCFTVMAAENTYTVSVQIAPDDEGNMRGGRVWITLSGSEEELGTSVSNLPYGARIVLHAELPKQGYKFAGWEEEGGGNNSPVPTYEIPVKRDSTYTAHFEAEVYDIKYTDSQLLTGKYPLTHTYGKDTVIPVPDPAPGYTFEGWHISSAGYERDYRESSPLVLGGDDFVGDITLTPIFQVDKIGVDFEDRIEGSGDDDEPLGSGVFECDFNAKNIGGKDAPQRSYRGYYWDPSDPNCKSNTLEWLIDPDDDGFEGNPNRIIRYYRAKFYTVVYEGCDIANGRFTYGQDFQLPSDPVRRGYTFVGWKIGDSNSEKFTGDIRYENGIYTIPGDAYDTDDWVYGKENRIVLVAQWKPNQYHITYEGVSPDGLPDGFVYNESIEIPNPTRPGYVFAGWMIRYEGETLSELRIDLTIVSERYAGDIVLIAQWDPGKFHVTLDSGYLNGTNGFDIDFNSPVPDLSPLPAREGHIFRGYYALTEDGGKDWFFDENGVYVHGTDENLGWNVTGSITLIAEWEPIIYQLNFSYDPPDQADIRIKVTVDGKDYWYDGDPLSFPYGSSVTVSVMPGSAYRVVMWQGTQVSRVKTFTTNFVLTGNMTATFSMESALAIFGDTELLGILVALCVILLCQVIAILILVVRRHKYAKEARQSAFALPLIALFLGALPEKLVYVVLLLAALVVVFQIILTWLLLTSDVIFRKKKKTPDERKPTTAGKEDAAKPADIDMRQDTPLHENSDYENFEDYYHDGGEEEPDLTDVPTFEPDSDPDLPGDEDWYGDDGFIEPAVNPKHSLPDDDQQ